MRLSSVLARIEDQRETWLAEMGEAEVERLRVLIRTGTPEEKNALVEAARATLDTFVTATDARRRSLKKFRAMPCLWEYLHLMALWRMSQAEALLQSLDDLELIVTWSGSEQDAILHAAKTYRRMEAEQKRLHVLWPFDDCPP